MNKSIYWSPWGAAIHIPMMRANDGRKEQIVAQTSPHKSNRRMLIHLKLIFMHNKKRLII
jgi:hypothetical protein